MKPPKEDTSPPWSGLLSLLIHHERMMALRLAEHDPVKAAYIDSQLTLTEIAECQAVKIHDNYSPDDDED